MEDDVKKCALNLYPESWVVNEAIGFRIDNNASRRNVAEEVIRHAFNVLESDEVANSVMQAFYRRCYGKEVRADQKMPFTCYMGTALLAARLAIRKKRQGIIMTDAEILKNAPDGAKSISVTGLYLKKPFGVSFFYSDGEWLKTDAAIFAGSRSLSDIAELEKLRGENERLKGIRPEFPPFPHEGEGLPRYGIKWNGPKTPLAVPMIDGYWTPYHLAESELKAARADLKKAKFDAIYKYAISLKITSAGFPLDSECLSKGSSYYNWFQYMARNAINYANNLDKEGK